MSSGDEIRDEAPEPAGTETTEVRLAYAGVSSLVTTEDTRPPRAGRQPPPRPRPARGDDQGAAPVPRGDGRPLRRRRQRLPLRAQGPHRLPGLPADAAASRPAWASGRRSRRTSPGCCATTRLAFVVLDPVVTVHPDQVLFEVFSKDEGTYARLGDRPRRPSTSPSEPACGTTNIDFSQSLFAGRPADAELPRDPAEHRPGGGEAGDRRGGRGAGEEDPACPTRGSAGFLQVQSAAALPLDRFRLAPIDLYNVLRHLRLHGDRKGKRRGLRIELVPGEPPRLVLEPWNEVIPATAGPLQGQGGARGPRLGPAPADAASSGSCRSSRRSTSTCSAAACRASGCSAARA